MRKKIKKQNNLNTLTSAIDGRRQRREVKQIKKETELARKKVKSW